MIDVVFQLLIYFLCTASFAVSEQFLPTMMPATGATAFTFPKEIQELGLIRITLDQCGDVVHIELNGNPVSSIGDLRDRLRSSLELAKLPAVLDAGPEVELGNVVAVYDACLLVGVNGIHLAAPERF